jgi:ribonuclease T2
MDMVGLSQKRTKAGILPDSSAGEAARGTMLPSRTTHPQSPVGCLCLVEYLVDMDFLVFDHARRMGGVWLAVVLLLVPVAGRAEAVHFDHYLLALAVAPAFCEDEPQRKRKFAQCRALSGPGFQALPLTLHGLWPNRADRRHPAYCGGESGGAFCRLPPVRLPVDTQARLRRTMPATADCLDRYQWGKHGSCSGLTEGAYFAAAAALTERVNRAIGSEIARHMGREVDLAVLRAVLAKRDPQLRDAVTFDCRTPHTPAPDKRRPMLREVRVYFERDPASGAPGRPLPYARAGAKHYNSGCPQGRAYVDTPLD